MTSQEIEETKKIVIELFDQEVVNVELAIKRLYHAWIISFELKSRV